MQKKVYLDDLSVEEITERLKKGETIYHINDDFFYKEINGCITRYEKGKPTDIGEYITICRDYYFLDEVEEPEADESCVDKLCWFWNTDEQEKGASLLAYIDNGYFTYDGLKWNHCKALTKEEALDFIVDNDSEDCR